MMRFAGRTHPGRRGGQNEDSIGWNEPERLWFVADGMGGHASGDVASRIVKETLLGGALPLPLEAMAVGALAHSHAQAAVAISGIAGPDGGTPEKPAGLVCYGWALEDGTVMSSTCRLDGDREEIRSRAVEAVLRGLIDLV